jgi:hypothetical protein
LARLPELVRDIAYLDDRNQNPRPYTWKADGAAILAKIKRARAAPDEARRHEFLGILNCKSGH